MNDHHDLQPDLQPVVAQLRANRPEATALELDAIKQRVLARVAQPARRRTRRAQLMKSRLVILTTLVLGMLLSTAGAGLAITGLSGNRQASTAAYPTPTPTATSAVPGGNNNVLGETDQGSDVSPQEQGGGNGPSANGSNPSSTNGAATQPSRQVEAGASSGTQLPFTGFAAVPILLGGLVLLTAGLVLRRRTADDR